MYFSSPADEHIYFSKFAEILEMRSKSWGHVDIGVIVCGPPTLQSSVAKEIRSYTFRRESHQSIFHFHSHSFDMKMAN